MSKEEVVLNRRGYGAKKAEDIMPSCPNGFGYVSR